jgi:hypothetical protein
VAETLRLARLYFVLLAIFTALRWTQSLLRKDYDLNHHYFSIVILTASAAFFYSAFGRRWYGLSLPQTLMLAVVMGLASQLVVVLSTLISYLLGIDTFFTHPRALNAPGPLPFGRAMGQRVAGLVFNTLATAVVAALGWVFGLLLPERAPRRAGATPDQP